MARTCQLQSLCPLISLMSPPDAGRLRFLPPGPVLQAIQELEAKFQFLRGIYRAHSKGGA